MAKPYFAESSKCLSDLFDEPMNEEQIDRIILSTLLESPKSHCILLGLVPEHMSMQDILGYNNSNFDCNVEFKKQLLKERMDINEFGKECYHNYELNKKDYRNTMAIVYFKPNKAPYHPLFFAQLCVPIGNLGVALLNKRKRYIYVGKYLSGLNEVIQYNAIVKKLQEEERILNRYSIEHMITSSKNIHARLIERFQNHLEESKAYSEKPF